MGDRKVHYSSGSHITSFPNEGIVVAKSLKNQGNDNFKQCLSNIIQIFMYLFFYFNHIEYR